MKRIIIAFCTALVLLPCFVSASLVRWDIKDGGNNHFYEVVKVDTPINWWDAKLDAEVRGGYLTAINTPEENDFVSTLIKDDLYWKDIYFGPWIGGYQLPNSPEPDGGWTWVSGEPFDYTNWASTEPGNSTDEDAIHFCNHAGLDGIYAKTVWNDLPSQTHYTHPIAYVVEYIPEPCTLLLLGVGGILIRKR